jgi:hypothetical protein
MAVVGRWFVHDRGIMFVRLQSEKMHSMCKSLMILWKLWTVLYPTECQTRTNAGFPGPDTQHHHASRAARQKSARRSQPLAMHR